MMQYDVISFVKLPELIRWSVFTFIIELLLSLLLKFIQIESKYVI